MIGQQRQIFIPCAALARAPERVVNSAPAVNGAGRSFRTAVEHTENMCLAGTRKMKRKAAAIEGPVEPAESKWATALSHDEPRRAKALIRPVPKALEHEMAQVYELARPDGKDAD